VEELHIPVNESAYVIDIMQTDVHTAEPLVRDPSRLEVEVIIAKLKSIHARL
jgi:hypothetical protein